mgnify:CR=1 FL=1
MKRIPWAIIGMLLVCAVAVPMLYRFAPFSGRPEPTSGTSPALSASDVAFNSHVLAPLDGATDTPEALEATQAAIRLEVGRQLGSLPTPLSESERSQIVRTVTAWMGVVFAGDVADHERYIADLGGTPFVPGTPEPEKSQARRLWAECLSAYRQAPVSVDQVVVRTRVAQGLPLAAPEGGLTVRSVFGPRFTALNEVVQDTPYGTRITGDTVEILIPVMHTYEGVPTRLLVGVWLTRSPRTGQWLPSKTTTYSPSASRAIIVVPPI